MKRAKSSIKQQKNPIRSKSTISQYLTHLAPTLKNGVPLTVPKDRKSAFDDRKKRLRGKNYNRKGAKNYLAELKS